MPDLLSLPFAREALLEIALLAVGAGLIGTWVVLRGLAFYAHAVGAATFPGLVLADGLGFAATLGAAGTGVLCALGVGLLLRSDRARDRADTATALVLCGALALGVILASDVFGSGGNVEQLLFGSLLLIDGHDLALAGAASLLAVVVGLVLEPRWVATGFDPENAPALGLRSGWPEHVLLALVGFVALATLAAVGALLATALIVVPAATTRLVCTRLRTWQAVTIALVLAEGVAGVWLSLETDAPPGATIAVLSAGLFAVVAIARELRRRGRGPVALAAAALLALGIAGCGDDAASPGTVRVVATTTQLGDLVRDVGGRDVTVTQLLKPSSDPHDYEPRPSDVRAVADATLVVKNGGDLDRWVGKVVAQSGAGDDVLDAGAGRPVVRRAEGDVDPHWWHDPRNAEHAVGRIRDALAAAAPAKATAFRRNAETALTAIRAADRDIARCFAAVPANERKVVTDHDALGYFAGRYGIDVVGTVIPALTTQAQPSAGDLKALTATVRREGVGVVFPESSVNARLAKAIASATGVRVGGALYADTLGARGSAGATYLGALRANADTIVRGLTDGRRGCPR